LVYQNGKLVQAKTRGSGKVGEDVTDKARWVSDALPKVDDSFTAEVRGELYCSETQFLHLSDEMVKVGLERPTAPRNIVAGVLGRKNHYDLARFFNFFAFEVVNPAQRLFKTEMEKFSWLEKVGFRLPEPKLIGDEKDLKKYLDFSKSVLEGDELGVDGAVFSYNELSLHEELGNTSHHPRYKMSFKWQGQTAISEIKQIQWATSRLGIVTPVAVIAPVTLSGAQITNITLHNASHVKSYQLKPGDEIELVRSGEVIPKFLRVVKSGKGSFQIPEKCPSCGTKLVDDDVRVVCLNRLSCPAQQIGSILNWIQCVGIDDLSEKRLVQMMEILKVQSAADLYRLAKEDFLKLPSTKEKMAEKLWKHIQGTKQLSLASFLNGLGIEGAGLTTWEKILEVHDSLSKVRKMTETELVSIPGFAEKSSAQIVAGLRERAKMIDQLLEVGVNPKAEAHEAAGEGKLSGKQFVITGALSQPRGEIEKIIKKAGGKISSSVSSHTFVLVTNEQDSSSSKMKKAKQLGTTIWSEQQLLKELEAL